MAKFVVIYTAPETAEDVMANNDPEAAAEGMQAWMAWAGKAGENLSDLGAPLGNGRELTLVGESATGSGVSGYSFLEAGSMEEALRVMEGHPHLMMPGASIQVYEALPIPGM